MTSAGAVSFRLTREVRFSLNDAADDQLSHPPANSFGGYPSLTGIGRYFTARITLRGNLQPESQYLVNIKEVDSAVRDGLRRSPDLKSIAPTGLLRQLANHARAVWPDRFESVDLLLTPYLNLSQHLSDGSMMRLSQRFEFSASHRLHNPQLSDEENRRIFGKCNNPLGHGHNYEVQVTISGEANESGLLVNIPEFEQTVADTVIDRFDHRHLNTEVPEFNETIPSVENIAMTIYRLLKPKFTGQKQALHSVTVWETSKTWCEYSE